MIYRFKTYDSRLGGHSYSQWSEETMYIVELEHDNPYTQKTDKLAVTFFQYEKHTPTRQPVEDFDIHNEGKAELPWEPYEEHTEYNEEFRNFIKSTLLDLSLMRIDDRIIWD